MKRIFAVTLSIAMLFSMTVIAADEYITGGTSKDVTATYEAGTNGGTIYSVDITWGSLEYTYKAASTGTWNPATHEYDNASGESWTCVEGADTITVTNHSNAEVTATMNFKSSADNVTGVFDNASLELATAVGTEKENAPSESAKLTLGGSLAETAERVTVGTVTVTIDGNSDSNSESNTINKTPIITSMSTNDGHKSFEELKESGLTINVSGENLQYITTATLSKYVTITADVSENNRSIIENAKYEATSDTTAIITFSTEYFKNGAMSDFSNLQYEY